MTGPSTGTRSRRRTPETKNGGNAKRKNIYATSMRDDRRNAARNKTNGATKNVTGILGTTPIRPETPQYATQRKRQGAQTQ